MTRQPVLLVALFALLATSGCSIFSSKQALNRLDLEFSNPEITFPYGIEIEVAVVGPEGSETSVKPSSNQGGLVSTLCFDLCRRLKRRGCEATYRDLDAAAPDEDPMQKLRRAQRQIVELPEGWTFVFARTLGTYPIKDQATSKDANSTHLTFTMRTRDGS